MTLLTKECTKQLGNEIRSHVIKDVHVIGFSDLVDLWVIKIKKAHDPLRT